MYGIRVYPSGAVLATHVDRLPLVASAIINVDQDVDEPWYVFIIRVTLLGVGSRSPFAYVQYIGR